MKYRTLTAAEFDSLSAELVALGAGIVKAKRPEYTLESANALQNFDSIAERYGLTPMQVIFVYWQKHLDALASNLALGVPNSENIDTRFADALNYLLLLYAAYKREQGPTERRVFDNRSGSSDPNRLIDTRKI